MPQTRVPKLNLGRTIAKPRPTKAMSSKTKGSVQKGILIGCGLLFLTGLTLMILEAAGVKIFSRKRKQKAALERVRRQRLQQRRRAKQRRKLRRRRSKRLRMGIDRRIDIEEPTVSVAKVIDAPASHKNVQTAALPPNAQIMGIDKQFQSFDTDSMNKQFTNITKPPRQHQAVKSSQLRRDAVMPSFSVNKQPARQVGLAVDLVFNDLRRQQTAPTTVSSEQVPFGGSEFQEMLRNKSIGNWTDHH
jgi:hypothetical protein